MGHRLLFRSIPIVEMDNDQHRGYPHPQLSARSENGPYVIHSESVPVSGINPVATSRVPSRSTEFMPWCSISYLSPHMAPPALLVPHGLQLAPGSSNQVALDYPQHEIPRYRDEAGPSNSHSQLEREHLRRKRPAVSASPVNSTGYSMSGSSHIQNSEYLHNKPMPSSQIQPWETMVTDHRGGRLLVPGEGSHRNVRRRHNSPLEPYLSGSQVPSNRSLPGYALYPTADLPGPNMNGHWNHNIIPVAPHVAISSPSPGHFNIDINQPIFGNTTANGGYANSLPSAGYVTVPFPVHHIPGRGISGSQNNSAQRPATYRPLPNYSALDDAVTSSEVVSSHSRPLFIGEPRGTERSGRTRHSRFQTLPTEFMGHGRWRPEALVAWDRSVYYDSRNLLDQHRDMRLDVDSMSYEELLALGERIGNVSTGLTEQTVLKYLKETIYCSSDQVEEEEEVDCAICLESYNDGDELGMLKCRHDYHMTCIKKWLLIKNACPICKSPAAEK